MSPGALMLLCPVHPFLPLTKAYVSTLSEPPLWSSAWTALPSECRIAGVLTGVLLRSLLEGQSRGPIRALPNNGFTGLSWKIWLNFKSHPVPHQLCDFHPSILLGQHK